MVNNAKELLPLENTEPTSQLTPCSIRIETLTPTQLPEYLAPKAELAHSILDELQVLDVWTAVRGKTCQDWSDSVTVEPDVAEELMIEGRYIEQIHGLNRDYMFAYQVLQKYKTYSSKELSNLFGSVGKIVMRIRNNEGNWSVQERDKGIVIVGRTSDTEPLERITLHEVLGELRSAIIKTKKEIFKHLGEPLPDAGKQTVIPIFEAEDLDVIIGKVRFARHDMGNQLKFVSGLSLLDTLLGDDDPNWRDRENVNIVDTIAAPIAKAIPQLRSISDEIVGEIRGVYSKELLSISAIREQIVGQLSKGEINKDLAVTIADIDDQDTTRLSASEVVWSDIRLGRAVGNIVQNVERQYEERDDRFQEEIDNPWTLNVFFQMPDEQHVYIVFEDRATGYPKELLGVKPFQMGVSIRETMIGEGTGMWGVQEALKEYDGAIITDNISLDDKGKRFGARTIIRLPLTERVELDDGEALYGDSE